MDTKGKRLVAIAHPRKTLSHKLLHDTMACVLRIRAHTCDKAYLVALTIYIHIKRIYRKLSHKLLFVVYDIEAAKHISSLKHRKLRLLDFIIFPTGLGKICLCYLKA